jgi:hypothetical protein
MVKKRSAGSNAAAKAAESGPWLSIISIAVSLIALLIAGLTWHEARQTRIAPVLDVLRFNLDGPASTHPVRIIENKYPQESRFVAVPFEGVLANNGISTVSVVSFGFSQVGPGMQKTNSLWYPQLPQGIFDANTGNPIVLPLVLEAGKVQPLVIVVGLAAGKKAFSFMSEAGGTISANNLMFGLAAKNIDLYDNPVKPNWTGAEVTSFGVTDLKMSQQIRIDVNTARGTKECVEISWNSGHLNMAQAKAPEIR